MNKIQFIHTFIIYKKYKWLQLGNKKQISFRQIKDQESGIDFCKSRNQGTINGNIITISKYKI